MTGAFLTVVNMSIVASLILLVVLLLRLFFKKSSKWPLLLLWGMVALRLVLPFAPESSLSLMPDVGFIHTESIDTQAPQLNGGTEGMGGTQAPTPGGTQTPVIEGTQTPPTEGTILPDIGGTQNPTVGEITPPAIGGTQYPTVEDTQAPVIGDIQRPATDGADVPEGNGTVTMPTESAPDSHRAWLTVLSAVWIGGMLLLLIYTVFSYLRVRQKVLTAVRMRENIYQSENVVSPFVLGIIKPKIYLSFAISEQNAAYVIAHERAHIRRLDHIWKLVGFLLLTLHWFNPLMWVGYVLLCRDIELACDEKVVKPLEPCQRADYSQALLSCSVNRRTVAACPLAFGEVSVKERVKNVLNYKKPALWVMVAVILVLIVTAVCFLTNPKTNEISSFNELDENLQAFVKEQIEAHYKTDATEERFVAVSCELLDMEEFFGETKLYAWVMYAEYSDQDGTLTREVESHIPTVITVKRNGDGYESVKYWTPRDGAYWEGDVKGAFPRGLWEKALDSQATVERQRAECSALAEKLLSKDDPKEDEKSENILDEIFGKESNVNAEDGTIAFMTNIDITDPNVGYPLRYSVVVHRDRLYVEGFLYEKVTYVENFSPTFSEAFLSKAEEDAEISATVEKIKNEKGCYLLESDTCGDFHQKIALYRIEDTYYFLNLVNDSEDNLVHSMTSGKLTDIQDLKLWAGVYLGETLPLLLFERDEDDFYFYVRPNYYTKFTYTENFNLIYSQELLARANGDKAILENLNQIKNQKSCYILNTPGDEPLGTIVAYEIDGAYYFVQLSENNLAVCIWKMFEETPEEINYTPIYDSIPEFGDGACGAWAFERDLTEELEVLRIKYPMYFDLPMDNGLELYVWQEEEDAYSCVLVPAKDPDYTPEEISALNLPVISMEEAGVIATAYCTDGSVNLKVVTIVMPHSDYEYENDNKYQRAAEVAFLQHYPIDGLLALDKIVFDIDFDGVDETCYIGEAGNSSYSKMYFAIVENNVVESYTELPGSMQNMHFRGIGGRLFIQGDIYPGYNKPATTYRWEISFQEGNVIVSNKVTLY